MGTCTDIHVCTPSEIVYRRDLFFHLLQLFERVRIELRRCVAWGGTGTAFDHAHRSRRGIEVLLTATLRKVVYWVTRHVITYYLDRWILAVISVALEMLVAYVSYATFYQVRWRRSIQSVSGTESSSKWVLIIYLVNFCSLNSRIWCRSILWIQSQPHPVPTVRVLTEHAVMNEILSCICLDKVPMRAYLAQMVALRTNILIEMEPVSLTVLQVGHRQTYARMSDLFVCSWFIYCILLAV